MAKPRFTLTLAPTFKAKVQIPIPGKSAEPVEFTFRGRTRDEFKEFMDGLKSQDDIDAIMDIASGWELDDVFDAKNVNELIQNYIGSARAILDTYIAELTNARLGN